MKTREREQLKQSSGWLRTLGIATIVLGIIAIAYPFFISIAIELFLGFIFFVAGIVQIVHTIQVKNRIRKTSSLLLQILLGALYIALGVLLLTNPLAGVISITLLVGIFCFFDGVFRVFLAYQIKPASNWGWVLTQGILSIVIGILIWSRWPFYAPWILGLLVGIVLLINGLFALLFPTAAREKLLE